MIEISNLVMRRGTQVVLNGISLEVARAEIVAVIGPSGCGKTTLLKCLAGLERPDAGSIKVACSTNGDAPVDLVKLSEEELNQFRRSVGMVFQYAALFDSMTVYENVAFPLLRFRADLTTRQVRDEVARLLDQVGLNPAQDCDKLPAQLSGGMRKRVGLARALALEPEIILYDEPSSGLDPVSAANIDRLIVAMRDTVGVTSVVVSHHVSNVMLSSDRVAMLYGGDVLAVGSPAEVGEAADPRVRQFIAGSADGPLTDIER